MKHEKRTILFVILAEALIYLFLLVGLPWLTSFITFGSGCNVRIVLPPSIWFYSPPLLMGLLFIVLIWRGNKEVKNEND